MPTPIAFDDVIDSKRPAGLTLELINDTVHADAVNQAAARVEQLRQRGTTGTSLFEAEQALDEVRAAAAPHVRYWRFVAIGREVFEKLRDAHPSNSAQRKEYQRKMTAIGQPGAAPIVYNMATFPPALIAASCVGVFATEDDAEAAVYDPDEPYLTLEQAQTLWDSERFNSAELDALFSAALYVNTTTRTASLGNG